jgi:hypothetical protein
MVLGRTYRRGLPCWENAGGNRIDFLSMGQEVGRIWQRKEMGMHPNKHFSTPPGLSRKAFPF